MSVNQKKGGRYSAAKLLCTRSLAIIEQQLGADHPAVTSSLNNLANLYRLQGRYSAAKLLYTRTLAICMTVLSETHPQTAWGNFWYPY